jgi:hypothetical protein
MIRALLAGRKTQTRRPVKLNVAGRVQRGGRQWHVEDGSAVIACPYGKAGDLLWVKETYALMSVDGRRVSVARAERMPPGKTLAQTDGGLELIEVDAETAEWCRTRIDCERWKPSIFMPRWASRITLRITEVRCERLQNISEEDAIAEGVEKISTTECGNDVWKAYDQPDCGKGYLAAGYSYKTLWESINGAGSWDANPWVWAVSFEAPAP